MAGMAANAPPEANDSIAAKESPAADDSIAAGDTAGGRWYPIGGNRGNQQCHGPDLGELMNQIVGRGNRWKSDGKRLYPSGYIAGYNYAACRYEPDGITYPNRIIVGSETYPQDLGCELGTGTKTSLPYRGFLLDGLGLPGGSRNRKDFLRTESGNEFLRGISL